MQRRLEFWPREPATIVVADVAGQVVSAAWLVTVPGTRFAGLWGGSTLEEWRSRGVYRTLVAERARLAISRGIDFLWVDASAQSRPILERLGMTAMTETTPWVWSPVR
jgi:hypothetical protein